MNVKIISGERIEPFNLSGLEARVTNQLNSMKTDFLSGDEAIRKELTMKVEDISLLKQVREYIVYIS
jgi:hypothetical protein